MNKFIFYMLISISLLFNGCGKPEQPPLSINEKQFFEDLKKKYSCSVDREIEPALLYVISKKEVGNYFLELNGLPCDIIKKEDSLKTASFDIAKKLYNQILEKDMRFNEITINFECSIAPNQSRSKSFDYRPSQLK